MILVINEWIFHDLLGENGQDSFRETARFVIKLDRSVDTMVMPVEERWKAKANRLWGMANPVERQVGRLLLNLFLDSKRCIRLESGDMPATSLVDYDWAPTEDVYLIEAFVASSADLLVTTDVALFQAIEQHGQFSCQMRDDFLAGYGLSG